MYIFDIDGTLADLTHRLRFIQDHHDAAGRIVADWDSFFEACSDDKPILDVIPMLHFLQTFDACILSTGRPERVRSKTLDWLKAQRIFPDGLYMRRDGDHRPDNIVKSELLDLIILDWKVGHEQTIKGVFEDRDRVVEMYRARGFRVYQVAKGDF